MKLLRLWTPPILWMIIIFLLSSRQRVQVSDVEQVNFLFFKTLHVMEYYMLYALSFRAVKNSYQKGPKRQWFMVAFLICFCYAASDELHQLFVPTREGTVRDVIIDAVGAVFAWISITRLLPKAPKRLQSWAKHWQIL